jgi:hypothetical protein
MTVSRYEEDFQLLKLVFLGEMENRLGASRLGGTPRTASEPSGRA